MSTCALDGCGRPRYGSHVWCYRHHQGSIVNGHPACTLRRDPLPDGPVIDAIVARRIRDAQATETVGGRRESGER